jgi:hypothetical protein
MPSKIKCYVEGAVMSNIYEDAAIVAADGDSVIIMAKVIAELLELYRTNKYVQSIVDNNQDKFPAFYSVIRIDNQFRNLGNMQ